MAAGTAALAGVEPAAVAVVAAAAAATPACAAGGPGEAAERHWDAHLVAAGTAVYIVERLLQLPPEAGAVAAAAAAAPVAIAAAAAVDGGDQLRNRPTGQPMDCGCDSS